MSRLYSWLQSDTLKTIHTARGNQELEFKLNWGSRSDSKKLCRVWVDYRKGTEKPIVWIMTDDKNTEVHLSGID